MTRALTVAKAAAARGLYRVCLDREVQETGAGLASRRTAQRSTAQHSTAQRRTQQSTADQRRAEQSTEQHSENPNVRLEVQKFTGGLDATAGMGQPNRCNSGRSLKRASCPPPPRLLVVRINEADCGELCT